MLMTQPIEPQPASRLLSLPVEIRLQILDETLYTHYSWVYASRTIPKKVRPGHGGPNDDSKEFFGPASSSSASLNWIVPADGHLWYFQQPQYIMTCRQLYEEIYPRWASRASFHSVSYVGVIELLRFLNQRGIKKIHRLVVRDGSDLIVEAGPKKTKFLTAEEVVAQATFSQDQDASAAAAQDTLPTLGDLSRRACERVTLAQIIASFDIHITFLKIFGGDCIWDRPFDMGYDFGVLTAAKWDRLVVCCSHAGPAREEVLQALFAKLSIKLDMFERKTNGVDCELDKEEISSYLCKSWPPPDWFIKSGTIIYLDGPRVELMEQDRMETIEAFGADKWEAGLQIIRNWGMIEARCHEFGFEDGSSVIQVVEDDPEDFMACLKSRQA